jgi:hypothetical protein
VDWKRNKNFFFPTNSRLATLLKESPLPRPEGEGETKDKNPTMRLESGIRKPDGPDSFLLVPFTTLMNMTGDGASQPLLQEMFGLHSRLYWRTWAEMHPERAARFNLEDGELIRVVSREGTLTLPVKIVPTVSPEILSVPFGNGHTESGRDAKIIGANPVAVLDNRVDPLSGRNSWQSTFVRVEKINR